MGLSHSPSIVTSNLVLCFDPANPKSYSGSGNTIYNAASSSNNGVVWATRTGAARALLAIFNIYILKKK